MFKKVNLLPKHYGMVSDFIMSCSSKEEFLTGDKVQNIFLLPNQGTYFIKKY